MYTFTSSLNLLIGRSFLLLRHYALPFPAKVKLIIYDILGREVATLVNEEQSEGWKEVTWNASTVSTGIYYYHLHTNNFSNTKKC
ncbi:MAG: T9SS type A sorting domain-containing protein [Bacteroidota bacterium]